MQATRGAQRRSIVSRTQFTRIVLLSLAAAVVAAVFITWASTPFAHDIRQFFSSARQADFHGNFPFNVFRSWELKPVGTRLIVYSIYRITVPFVDFADKADFEKVAKLVYGFIVLGIAFLSVFSIRKSIRQLGFDPLLVFGTVLISFYFLSFYSSLEAEDFSVLLFVAAIALGLANSRSLNVLSGFLLGSLFFTKGITILLAPQFLLVLIILGEDYRQRLYRCTSGIVVFLVISIGALLLLYPEELRQLYDGATFQSSLLTRIQRIESVAGGYLQSVPHVPILLPGLIFAWISVPLLAWRSQWPQLGALFGLWAVSGLIVLLQGFFFEYHYVVFMIPAIYSIYLLLRLSSDSSEQTPKRLYLAVGSAAGLVVAELISGLYFEGLATRLLLAIVLITIGGVFALMGLIFLTRRALLPSHLYPNLLIGLAVAMAGAAWLGYQSPWGLGSEFDGRSSADHIEYAIFADRWQLSEQDVLLILGDGKMVYYYDSRTACRFFYTQPDRYPLVNPQIADGKPYRETLECILAYEGEFILHNPTWFDLERFPEIDDKISMGYEQVDESCCRPLVVFRRK